MVKTACRTHSVSLEGVEVHALGGYDPAITTVKAHNSNPAIQFPAVAFVDGDQPNLRDEDNGIHLLPGTSGPDSHVFASVQDHLDRVLARLTVALQLRTQDQDRVHRTVQDRAARNRDRHLVFVQIGEDLDFTSEIIVRQAFLTIWA